MQTDGRLTVLESALQGKERVLAWLKKAQALGGFCDHCRAPAAPFLIEDEETAFLFNLVNRCNVEVLEISVSPIGRLFAMYLIRVLHSGDVKVNEVELRGFPALLLDFVVEGLALEAAIEHICRTHVCGNQVLFSDVQQKLSERKHSGEHLQQGYNALAPQCGFDPIRESDVQSALSQETGKKEDVLIRLSRAEAAAGFGNVKEARELLLPLIGDDLCSTISTHTAHPE